MGIEWYLEYLLFGREPIVPISPNLLVKEVGSIHIRILRKIAWNIAQVSLKYW